MKKILYIQYTNPAGVYNCLENSSNILAERGWKVVFIGIRAYGEADNFEMYSHGNIILKCLNRYRGRGIIQKLDYVYYALYALCFCFFWRPQWVYASDPLSCPAALILKKVLGKKVVYHEHDSPEPNSKKNSLARLYYFSRKYIAKKSQVCILPSMQRLRIFLAETKREQPSFCVRNCTRKKIALDDASKKDPGRFNIIYSGSLNKDRLPGSVIDSLLLLPGSVRLVIIGYETIGNPGYRDLLRQRAARLGIADKLAFLSFRYLKQVYEYCASCDLGLSLFSGESGDINLRYMADASAKTYMYLSCGLPVLVSALADWEERFVKPGYGLSCNPRDPADIARAISWVINHPRERRQITEKAREKILDDWNYEKQFEPVLDILQGKA